MNHISLNRIFECLKAAKHCAEVNLGAKSAAAQIFSLCSILIISSTTVACWIPTDEGRHYRDSTSCRGNQLTKTEEACNRKEVENVKVDSLFPSRFVKVADVGSGLTMTIRDVIVEKVGDSEKPCLQFKEGTKLLPLNKTNGTTLAKAFGEETDDWIGKKIGLQVEPVEYAGRTMDGIRIRIPQPVSTAPAEGGYDDNVPY